MQTIGSIAYTHRRVFSLIFRQKHSACVVQRIEELTDAVIAVAGLDGDDELRETSLQVCNIPSTLTCRPWMHCVALEIARL